MTIYRRYDPFREAVSLRNAIDQLFAQSFVHPGWSGAGVSMLAVPMDVYETDHGYQVRALLPGVKPEDVELTVQQNTLLLKGQLRSWVEEGKQVNWLAQEIGTGSFERSITFPKPIDADKIETSYEHGVLSIFAPVTEESRPKRISISQGQPKQITVEAGQR